MRCFNLSFFISVKVPFGKVWKYPLKKNWTTCKALGHEVKVDKKSDLLLEWKIPLFWLWLGFKRCQGEAFRGKKLLGRNTENAYNSEETLPQTIDSSDQAKFDVSWWLFVLVFIIFCLEGGWQNASEPEHVGSTRCIAQSPDRFSKNDEFPYLLKTCNHFKFEKHSILHTSANSGSCCTQVTEKWK